MQQLANTGTSEDQAVNLEPSTPNKIAQLDLQAQIEGRQQNEYHEEKYRWVIVVLVSIAFTINNLSNNAIIPISSKVAKVYQLSETYANLPIQISFLIIPIMNLTVGQFIDSKGLGISFRIGAVLYAVGLLGYCLINHGYHWVLLGAIIIAFGQPLIMNCTAKVATDWFMSKNRTLATGIISAINLVTLGVSLVFPALFVDQDSQGDDAKDQIYNLYSKYFIAAVANCLLVMFFMRQKPDRLPSAGAQQQKTTMKQTIQIIKEDRNVWRYFIAAILLYGTFLSFGSTSNMLFKPYGFEDTQIAIFGVCLLVSGVLGSVAYTLYIKKTLNYRKAIICACSFALVFIITNALVMNFATSQKVLISCMILGMGFNLIPMVPISYDLGCELTFPVGQVQIVGILAGGAMIYTIILTLSITAAVGFGTVHQSAICVVIYILLFSLGAILYCTVEIKLKRRIHQGKKQQQKKTGQYDVNLTINDSAKNSTLLRPLGSKKNSQSEQILILTDQIANNSILSQEKSQGSKQNQFNNPPSPELLSSPIENKSQVMFAKTNSIKVSPSTKI